MKIHPVASGGAPSINPNEGKSADSDRMARAIAIAGGQSPDTVKVQPQSDPQVDRAQNSIKKIKMRTQFSPDRTVRQELPIDSSEGSAVASVEVPESDTPASIEQVPAVSEDTKPLSPQFAALARQKREVQIAQKALADQRAAFDAEKQGLLSEYIPKSALKSNALKTLLAEGVTYDELTEQILAQNTENPDLSSLKAEIQALKEGLENQNKSLTERDANTEKQVLGQIRRDVDQLISEGDDFEMIREAGYAQKVVDLIHRTYKKSGELLDHSMAASLIETELLEESLKFAQIKKVQSRLNPPAPAPQQKQPVQQDRPGTKVMRTLTNRDGASSLSMSKRERAIAAMEGRLK